MKSKYSNWLVIKFIKALFNPRGGVSSKIATALFIVTNVVSMCWYNIVWRTPFEGLNQSVVLALLALAATLFGYGTYEKIKNKPNTTENDIVTKE
jgi:hypothetical protein